MITDSDIRIALLNEYEFLCHECEEDDDMTIDEYKSYLTTLNREQLIAETTTDEMFTLEEFVVSYSY